MNAVLLAGLLTVLTAAQIMPRRRTPRIQSRTLGVLFFAELALLLVLALNGAVADSLAAWVLLGVFGLANAALALWAIFRGLENRDAARPPDA